MSGENRELARELLKLWQGMPEDSGEATIYCIALGAIWRDFYENVVEEDERRYIEAAVTEARSMLHKKEEPEQSH